MNQNMQNANGANMSTQHLNGMRNFYISELNNMPPNELKKMAKSFDVPESTKKQMINELANICVRNQMMMPDPYFGMMPGGPMGMPGMPGMPMPGMPAGMPGGMPGMGAMPGMPPMMLGMPGMPGDQNSIFDPMSGGFPSNNFMKGSPVQQHQTQAQQGNPFASGGGVGQSNPNNQVNNNNKF